MALELSVKSDIEKMVGSIIECRLANIIILGEVRGCCGSLRNPKTGTIVHVNTEIASPQNDGVKYSYRISKNLKFIYEPYSMMHSSSKEHLALSLNSLLRQYYYEDIFERI